MLSQLHHHFRLLYAYNCVLHAGIDCGVPPPLTNGSIVYRGTLYEDKATIFCIENHWLKDISQYSDESVCSQDGNWIPQFRDCTGRN